jgi:uncharacterized protein YcfJ
VRVVTLNLHAIKTVLLALTATASFVAAIVVGMGLGTKKTDYRQVISCEPGATTQMADTRAPKTRATC